MIKDVPFKLDVWLVAEMPSDHNPVIFTLITNKPGKFKHASESTGWTSGSMSVDAPQYYSVDPDFEKLKSSASTITR